MNKQEFFEKLLQLYQKTGRGIQPMVISMMGFPMDDVEQLVNEGKLEKVDSPIGDWYYPVGYYCSEKEDNSISALVMVDAYLGEIDSWMKISVEDMRKQSAYIEWKEKNKEILEKSFGEEK